MPFFVKKQEQQRVAVGPGNAQFMSIRQVSLRRGSRCPPVLLLLLRCWSCKPVYWLIINNWGPSQKSATVAWCRILSLTCVKSFMKIGRETTYRALGDGKSNNNKNKVRGHWVPVSGSKNKARRRRWLCIGLIIWCRIENTAEAAATLRQLQAWHSPVLWPRVTLCEWKLVYND